MAVFPFGVVVASASMINKNNRYYEEQRKREDEKMNTVKEIIVTYEDGTAKKIKHGFAIENFLDKKECVLDYMQCTDESLLEIVKGLVKLVKEKGLLN